MEEFIEENPHIEGLKGDQILLQGKINNNSPVSSENIEATPRNEEQLRDEQIRLPGAALSLGEDTYFYEEADTRMDMWVGEWQTNDIFYLLVAEDRNRERLRTMQPIMEDADLVLDVNMDSYVNRKHKSMESLDQKENNKHLKKNSTNELRESCESAKEDHTLGMDRGVLGLELPLRP